MSPDYANIHEYQNAPDGLLYPEGRFWLHFANVTSHILTLPSIEEADPIMSRIISRSIDDPVVMNSLLCLGASHLINERLLASSEEVENLVHSKEDILRKANSGLSARIASLEPQIVTANDRAECEALLTAHLLLYLYEISEGADYHSWRTRLDQARSFVYCMLRGQRHSSAGRLLFDMEAEGENPTSVTFGEDMKHLGIDKFLIEFFSYYDILGSVTDPRYNPNQQAHYPGSMSAQALQSGYFVHESILLGTDYGLLLDIIQRVRILQLDAINASVPSEMVILRGVHIWQEINDWMKHSDECSESGHSHMLESCFSAVSIWIFCIIHPGDIAEAKVQLLVSRGLTSLGSLEETTLKTAFLFPYLFIGLCCIQQRDRVALEGELERIESIRCLGYIQVCKETIRKSWQEYDRGNTTWEWTRVLKAGGLSMVLT